jgi:hypothetical protein
MIAASKNTVQPVFASGQPQGSGPRHHLHDLSLEQRRKRGQGDLTVYRANSARCRSAGMIAYRRVSAAYPRLTPL